MGNPGGFRTRAVLAVLACLALSVPVISPASASGRVTGAPAAPAPSPSSSALSDHEAAALKVIDEYDEAFTTEDCDLFRSVTTPVWRAHLGLEDCATFVQWAKGRSSVIRSVEVSPISTEGMGRNTLAALVHAKVDTVKNPDADTSGGSPQESDFRFQLARVAGDWKVLAVHELTGGRTEGQLLEGEQSAVDSMMELWRAAYTRGDCDALGASTTPEFREANGWADCGKFQQDIADQNAYCPMDVHQEDIRYHSLLDASTGQISVDVVQVCTLSVDEAGNPIDPPYVAGNPYRYNLVRDGDLWRIAEGDNGAAGEDEPDNSNERAAVDAIKSYNDAWLSVDCDAFLASTTDQLRTDMGLDGCASFGPAARDFNKGVANFASTPTDIERPTADRMEIKAHETYDSLTDADGNPAEPYPIDEYWVYTVVLVDDAWVIADFQMLV